MRYEEAAWMIKHNNLPEDFDQWEMANATGWTIAHEVAYFYGASKFPAGFQYWGLKTDWGKTVAGVAIENGGLPDDFTQWELMDCLATVAEISASLNKLPKTFEQWDLKCQDGATVFERAVSKGMRLENFAHWNMVLNEDGETCKDIYERMEGEQNDC